MLGLNVLHLEQFGGLFEFSVLDISFCPAETLKLLIFFRVLRIQVQSELEINAVLKVEVVEHHFGGLFDVEHLLFVKKVYFALFCFLFGTLDGFLDHVCFYSQIAWQSILHNHWRLYIYAKCLRKSCLLFNNYAELLPMVQIRLKLVIKVNYSSIFRQSVNDCEYFNRVGPIIAGVGSITNGEPPIHILDRHRIALSRLQRHNLKHEFKQLLFPWTFQSTSIGS